MLIAGALVPFAAQAMDHTLEAALARMDKAAAGFKGLTADMKRMHHTELVNENETDEGSITVKRFKADDTRILINFTKPEPRKICIGGGKAQIYNPKTNEVQVADVKKRRDLINEVLLLGFGASSADLKAAYTIQLGGADSVNGAPATRIELVPRNEEIRHSIKKCELWVPENGIPLQQKFYETGGDYQIATYSNIVLKTNLPDSAVRLELPRGVKQIDLK
ncbi:MAG: outer membrane lipoprotein carrier protein LolA [Acidobacteria bacterium]|nr:outer membrane lipoprotein carrier protein LolA [Acidobacteriota bacterium]